MEFVHYSLKTMIYFGAGISFLYAFLEIVKRNSSSKLLVLVMFLTGSILIRYGWYSDSWQIENPYLFLFLHTSITLVGPLLYLYGSSRLQNSLDEIVGFRNFLTKYGVHFSLPFFFAIFEIFYFQKDPIELRNLVRQSAIQFHWDLIHFGTLIACIQVSIYSLFCLHIYHKISRRYEIYELKLVWIILLLPVVANSMIGPAFFLKNFLLFEIGTSCISLIVLMTFVLKERNPSFFEEISLAIQTAKYQNTNLLPKDIQQADERLKEILERQKFYRDNELRLTDLAAGLGLTLHQTSRYLNEIHKMSFYELINHYRVKEACRLLIANPSTSVLEIGFEVGFNSKSTFNSQFVKVTGMSPALYRKSFSQKE
ncbi:DNA-binding helix-turn-helix protein [Leptospira broomii serovar Hurstbridge str. 5399]|uniref:DNA-binding helix-turn-helix protein n=1 Tax=Leptospira broomii serovar Hurstbridge str. 5399 TaxID=1049789 RepID=T0EWI6_9LEPT|nr:helix-turn-helix domain-containing protein [Leptospira broomii]EQA43225.1 DNA-binding helix-turn-helix protein [Leptospira broomii serovar Hurstbridge str. 5399]